MSWPDSVKITKWFLELISLYLMTMKVEN